MLEVFETLYSFFSTQTAFTNVCSTRIYPLVANEDVEYPFAICGLNQEEGLTKDADNFGLTISIYFKPDQFTECATFSDTVTGLVKDKWEWQSSNVNFITEDQSFVASINFIITK